MSESPRRTLREKVSVVVESLFCASRRCLPLLLLCTLYVYIDLKSCGPMNLGDRHHKYVRIGARFVPVLIVVLNKKTEKKITDNLVCLRL